MLLPVGAAGRGRPAGDRPAGASAASLWLAVVGTGVAYDCWFRGLTRMPAGAVSLIGLVNPVVGTALGVAARRRAVRRGQALGMVLVLGGRARRPAGRGRASSRAADGRPATADRPGVRWGECGPVRTPGTSSSGCVTSRSRRTARRSSTRRVGCDLPVLALRARDLGAGRRRRGPHRRAARLRQADGVTARPARWSPGSANGGRWSAAGLLECVAMVVRRRRHRRSSGSAPRSWSPGRRGRCS